MIRFSICLIAAMLLLVSCFKQMDIVVPVGDFEDLFIKDNTGLTSVELLGKKIFFDKSLSNPVGQSCASCHSPTKSFSDPLGSTLSEGAVKGSFGTRHTPTISYNTYSPVRFYNADDETYVGGLFWDGRANTLEEQASKPFLITDTNRIS